MSLFKHARSLSTILAFTLASATAAFAQNDSLPTSGLHWVGSWGASPAGIPGAASPVYSNQTIREVAHLSLGSNGLIRLRLSNALSNAPVTFGDVHVGVWAGSSTNPTSAIIAGTDRPVTFNAGSASVTIPSGGEVISDPVLYYVGAGANVVVSMYLPTNTTPATVHYFATSTSYIVPGDATSSTVLTNPSTYASRPYLSSIEVELPTSTSTIVALGDSITDGAYTTPDANLRWTDLLGAKLQQSYGNTIGVVNAGIAGEEILADNVYSRNIQTRINNALAVPGVSALILLEGINDIGNNPGLPASQIIAGYRAIIARAHEKGIKVIGATITPVQGFAPYYSVANEQVRQAVNSFIRNSGAFDGLIDFDKAVADPSNTARWLPAYTPDFLHPNNVGSQVMANAINLQLFNLYEVCLFGICF